MTVEAPVAPDGQSPEESPSFVETPPAEGSVVEVSVTEASVVAAPVVVGATVVGASGAAAPPSSGSLAELGIAEPGIAELGLAELGLAEPGASPADVPAEPVIDVRQIEGGIIEIVLPPNREIGGPEARAAGATVRKLADGRRVPVVLVISGVVGVSAEARQVYTGSIAASAFALVGESPVDRVIAHYLLRSKSETIPAEFFISRTEALEWLRPYTSEK